MTKSLILPGILCSGKLVYSCLSYKVPISIYGYVYSKKRYFKIKTTVNSTKKTILETARIFNYNIKECKFCRNKFTYNTNDFGCNLCVTNKIFGKKFEIWKEWDERIP